MEVWKPLSRAINDSIPTHNLEKRFGLRFYLANARPVLAACHGKKYILPGCLRALPGTLEIREILHANISTRLVARACVRVFARRRRDSAVLSARSRPAAALGGLADWRRSGNVAGGIDSAPQPQPHVCRRAAMIPKPCWPCNGFSAVTRKPLPTTRHDDAGQATAAAVPLPIPITFAYYRL